jgi:sulfatase maturation enzyme AslB (radical SAM superfamily)/predicted O-methyltransferase YrrM
MSQKTFCILPWVHLATQPDGTLNICCLSSQTLKADTGEELRLDTHSMEQIWGSQDLQNVRKKMLSNQKLQSCELCYQDEAIGKTSPRMMQNWNWEKKLGKSAIKNLIETYSNDPESFAKNRETGVAYFNFRFNNSCNLRCRMCFPTSSHGLSREFRELLDAQKSFPRLYKGLLQKSDLVSWSQNEKFVSNIQAVLPYLKEVYITGGEPMIGRETFDFLKMAVDLGWAKNIELTFHTNTTHWNESVVGLFPAFKKVTVNCSIDGHGIVDEYIRYPTSFSKVEDVFDKYLELTTRISTVAISIACSVSIYNVFSLPKLVSWYLEKKKQNKNNLLYIQFTLVHYPTFLNINLIPPSFRYRALYSLKKALELVKSAEPYVSPTINSLEPLVAIIQKQSLPKSEDIDDFMAFQLELDKNRNQSVGLYVPEVEKIVNFYLCRGVEYSQPMFPTTYKRLWLSHLGHLVNKKNLKYLEIGAYEGQSSSWVLKNILTDPTCTGTLIEPFFVEGVKQRFYKNMQIHKLLSRLDVYEEPSETALLRLPPGSFDLIYVDGNHTYEGVMSDALKSWPLLKVDGILVFDDYYWMKWLLAVDQRPEIAIDQFIAMMGSQIEVLHQGLQVFVRKKGELPTIQNTALMSSPPTALGTYRMPNVIGRYALKALYMYQTKKIDWKFQRLKLTDPEEMYPTPLYELKN